MTLEFWHSVFQFVSVALLGLTFAVGAGALWTGHRINQRQSERLLTLERDLTSAKFALAEQEARAATAERELLELHNRLAPRRIDSSARAAILNVLKRERPADPVNIEFVSGSTSEPYDLAIAISDLLKEASWAIDTFDGGPAIGNPPTGVIILVSDRADSPARAVLLHAALEAGGLSPRLVRSPDEQFRMGSVTLRVGLKP